MIECLTSTTVQRKSPPKMRAFFKLGVAGVFIGTVLFVVGCAKDRTTNEAHQQLVADQYHLYQGISGTYSGTIVNQKDGSPMGGLQVSLDAEINTINSSDGTTTTAQANLSGDVILSNEIESDVHIDTAYYFSNDNSNTGDVSGTIAMIRADISVVTMKIAGHITNGNQFTGTITTDNQPGITGVFNLKMNAPLNSVPNPSSGKVGGPNTEEVLHGNFPMDTSAMHPPAGAPPAPPSTQSAPTGVPATMTISDSATTSNERFYNNFAQKKLVDVAIILDTPTTGGVPPETGAAITFDNAEYDNLTNSISLKTKTSGDVTTNQKLSCLPGKDASGVAGLSCTYKSDYNNATYAFFMSP